MSSWKLAMVNHHNCKNLGSSCKNLPCPNLLHIISMSRFIQYWRKIIKTGVLLIQVRKLMFLFKSRLCNSYYYLQLWEIGAVLESRTHNIYSSVYVVTSELSTLLLAGSLVFSYSYLGFTNSIFKIDIQ